MPTLPQSPTCVATIVSQSDVLGKRTDDYVARCIRDKGHSGPHVCQVPEGHMFAWEVDCLCMVGHRVIIFPISEVEYARAI